MEIDKISLKRIPASYNLYLEKNTRLNQHQTTILCDKIADKMIHQKKNQHKRNNSPDLSI